MIVTVHARQRYVERIAPPGTSLDDAAAAIMLAERAVSTAARIGCRVVRLGCGGKLILDGATVVTVLGSGERPWAGHVGRAEAV